MNIYNKISAERIGIDNSYLSPFFFQQQKVYSFCKKFCKNKTILEIGSGTGYGTNRLAEVAKKVIAIDKHTISIEKCKIKHNKKNLKFINIKIEDYESKEKFDVVISLQVIEHIPSDKISIFFKSIITSLKKNGTFILSTPNTITSSYNENPYHYKEYSFCELYLLLSNYFKKITFYSIIGDKYVSKFEHARKKSVLSFLKKDIFCIRKIIPRKIRQSMFDLATYSNMRILNKKSKEFQKISEKNYKLISGKDNKSLDIVAVCCQPFI